MSPGFLHFNLRHGLSADLLACAMAELLGHTKPISAFLSKIFPDHKVDVILQQEQHQGLKGAVLQIYFDGKLLDLCAKESHFNSSKSLNFVWDRGISKTLEAHENESDQSTFFDLADQTLVSLDFIETIFKKAALNKTSLGLAIKILSSLKELSVIEPRLESGEALWLCCYLGALLSLLEALEPKFISCSRIFLGDDFKNNRDNNCFLSHPLLIRELAKNLPTCELSSESLVDALGLAFIKNLSSNFGTRSAGSILEIALGFSPSHHHLAHHYVEALWVEPLLPKSITDLGLNNFPHINHLIKVEALLPHYINIEHLCRKLVPLGASSIYYQLINRFDGNHAYALNLCVHEDQKKPLMKLLLLEGEAYKLISYFAEEQELKKRQVSLPLGQGQKAQNIRFYEACYLQDVARVDINAQDLASYAQKNNFSQEMARQNLLNLWQKWRGKNDQT